MQQASVERLRIWRSRLFKAYVFHVGWLTSTCACAATDATHFTVATTLWLTFATIPPVLVLTVLVHRACRAVDPAASSIGAARVLLWTLLLSPLESGLVLPAKNLWVATRLLRRCERDLAAPRARPPP